MIIKLNDLSFGYSSFSVLDDITLDLEGPKFISILGPNGVGKSTLIRCINKILTPKGGTVMIDDRNVNEITLKEMAKIIGYVPYAANDSFPLTVVDTVLMGRHPHSKWGSQKEDLLHVHETLQLLGIEDLAMRSFDELSAGQHQKVMLARGLVQDPQIILLDEPTANLDVHHQLEVMKILRDLSRMKNITVIMICHDLNIAAKYSDELVLMYQGKIFSAGKPEEVITEANLAKVYEVKAKVIDDEGRPHVILEDSVVDPVPEPSE